MKNTPLLPLALTLSLFALVSGCTSPHQSRIEKNLDTFNTYPSEVKTAIQRGDVVAGFTPEQVRLAQGEPDSVLTRSSEDGDAEVWVYREKSPRLGLGMGVGMSSGSFGTGLGMSTSGQFPDERLRVIFASGRVVAVEEISG